jgi:hypothetical protein
MTERSPRRGDHLRRIWRHRPGVVARRAGAHHSRAPREPGRCCAGSSRGAGKRTRGGGIPAWRWRVPVPASGALRGRQYPQRWLERALRCEPSVQPRRTARPRLSRQGTPAGRITTSEAIVPSDSPAAARASTKPASTSVCSAASSSAVTGARAPPADLVRLPGSNPGHLAFTQPAKRTIQTIYLQKSRVHFRWQNSHRSSRRPRYWVYRGTGGLRELWGYF